jgi:hypothetical protein
MEAAWDELLYDMEGKKGILYGQVTRRANVACHVSEWTKSGRFG